MKRLSEVRPMAEGSRKLVALAACLVSLVLMLALALWAVSSFDSERAAMAKEVFATGAGVGLVGLFAAFVGGNAVEHLSKRGK